MKKRTTARTMLRAWQKARVDLPDAGLRDDLAMLQSRDLDLSVRLGALLAFDALMLTVAVNPISASPGSPVSLDAPTQPIEVFVISVSILILAWAALSCVRGILIGEEFDFDTTNESAKTLAQRMFAAYCVSIDQQLAMIERASRLTIVGTLIALLSTAWIMAAKILG
jgi:hypothetical protein